MSIKKVIEIDVEQVKAMGGLDALKDSLKEVETRSSSLRTEFRKAQQEVAELSAKFGATSKEAINAAKRAGELGDKISDAKNLTDAFNPDAKFKAVSSSLAGVASGFAAYQGALGLVGVESKDLEKQLLKVQSAMAIAQGLQGLGEAKDSFVQLKAVAINAFEGIKKAIGSTGIGLLLVAIGTLYAYWDDIKEATSGVSDEQKEQNLLLNETSKKAKEQLSTLNSQDETLKRQGKTEREILELKQKQTQEALTLHINAIKDNIAFRKIQEETAARNKEILKGILDYVAYPIVTILKGIDAIGEKFGKTFGLAEKFKNFTAELLFDPEEVKAKGVAAAKEDQKILTELLNQRDGYTNQINAIDTAAKKKKTDDADASAKADAKALAESLKRQKENNEALQKEVSDAIGEAQDKNIEGQISAQETEIRLANEKYFRLMELATQFGLDTQALVDEQGNVINEINLKYQQVAYDAKKAADDKQAADDAIVAANKEAQLQGNISNLESILSIGGKKFAKVQKALAIAEIVRDTIRAVNAATGNEIKVPAFIGAIPNPVKPASMISTILGIGGAVAKGAASIAAITSDSKGVGGGGAPAGGASGGGSSTATPQFNLVGQSSTNQLTSTIAGQQNRPVQTFVVGSQVTSQQALDRNAQQNSVFG